MDLNVRWAWAEEECQSSKTKQGSCQIIKVLNKMSLILREAAFGFVSFQSMHLCLCCVYRGNKYLYLP